VLCVRVFFLKKKDENAGKEIKPRDKRLRGFTKTSTTG
jgi:hypothetical protein